MNVNEITLSRTASVSRVPQKNASTPALATTNPSVRQPASQDTVSLSFTDHTVASLAAKALQPLPSRQAKVEALKQSVQSGEYKPDAAKIATSLASASV